MCICNLFLPMIRTGASGWLSKALATLDRTKYAPSSRVSRGAYVLADASDHRPDVLLLAIGSEVSLCIRAYEKLKSEGIKARVISMPSWDWDIYPATLVLSD